ncbi:MAG: hypothetical protein ACO1OB_27475 [Archangium sp.]
MISAALALFVLTAEPTFLERLHGSVDIGGSLLEPSLHVGVEGGVLVGLPRIVLRAEWNPWVSLQTRDGIQPGVLNIGAGVEFRYFGDRLASVALVGTSTLLFRSAFDRPGHTGLFLYLQPTILRFRVGAHHLRVAPLSMAIVAPSLDAIPLIAAQFRTSLGFEW